MADEPEGTEGAPPPAAKPTARRGRAGAGASTDPGGAGAGDRKPDPELVQTIRDVVVDVLASGAGPAGDDGKPEGEPKAPTGPRGVELDLEQQVKAAMQTVRAEEEREGRLKTLEESVQKITPKPPERVPLRRRMMWGAE